MNIICNKIKYYYKLYIMTQTYNIIFVNEGTHLLSDLSNNKKTNTTIYEIGENDNYSDICGDLISPIINDGTITHVNIGFLYHNNTRGYLPFFRDEVNFSNNDEILITNQDEYFSSNIEKIIQDISGISSVNSIDLDIITCRNDIRSTTYLSEKEGVYGCRIFQTTGLIGFDGINNTQYNTLYRVSDNNTTKNIFSQYFDINPFSSYVNNNGNMMLLLLGPGELSFNGTSNTVFNLDQAYIDTNINDIRINGIDLSDSIINIVEDITIPNDFNFLIDNSGNNKVVINGNNKIITVTDFTPTGEFSGLCFLEEFAKIQINYLEVVLDSGINFAQFGSSFIQGNPFTTRRVHTLVEINNCENNNDLNGSDNGGMTGLATGFGGETMIKDCYNTGNLNGGFCGGIVGPQTGQEGSLTIQNCYNTGNINGNNSGGISGTLTGVDGEKTTISNCYNTGNINGVSCGGITGRQTGQDGSLTIQNCYNTGAINSIQCGGMTALFTGLRGETIISNCYNNGIIDNSFCGGITGPQTSQEGSLTVQNCYNSGNINGEYCGGITGPYACVFSSFSNKLLIEKCYNIGNITGISSGGISGSEIAFNSIIPCVVRDCYSTGAIDAPGCGGIIGDLFSIVNGRDEDISLNLTIENCYTTYKSFGINSSGIIGFIEKQPTNPNIVTRNCFSYDNGKIDQYGFLVGGNFNTSLLENGRLDRRLNTYGSYTSDNFAVLEYPLLRVFRDDITWNSDIYKNYNIAAVFGVSPPIDNRIKQQVLQFQTIDRGVLNMNNIINRRVLYQDILNKPNPTDNTSNYTRLLKLKYKKVFNKLQI